MNPLDIVVKFVPAVVSLADYVRKLIMDSQASEEEKAAALLELDALLARDVERVRTENRLTQLRAKQIPPPAPTV